MFTRGGWRSAASALAVCLGLLVSGVAHAAPGSAVCRSIQAQLSRGDGVSTNRKYSAAAARQRRELSKLRGQMASAGCSFFNSSPRCLTLSGMASKMSSNLKALSAKAGGGSGRSRASLLAALDANDCRKARNNIVVASRDAEPGILTRLFGGTTRPSASERKQSTEEPTAIWRKEGGARSAERGNNSGGRDRILRDPGTLTGLPTGVYRTFCVRTCDGYYFPMSPASTTGEMERDEKNCQAACPGAETTLYYHGDDQEDAEVMISRADGKPYEKLKMAFAYREASTLRSAQCSCGARPGTLALSTSGKNIGSVSKSSAAVPLPVNRPDPIADPETHSNLDGDLTVEAMRQLLSTEVAATQIGQRSIRVVGPMFLPDPATAKVRPAPARTVAR